MAAESPSRSLAPPLGTAPSGRQRAGSRRQDDPPATTPPPRAGLGRFATASCRVPSRCLSLEQSSYKSLILLVGAVGIEPTTR